MNPVDSNTGRNTAGVTSPRAGSRHRNNASAPLSKPCEIELRLVMQLELLTLQRRPQTLLER
jgi:hypothetical protein